MAGFSSLESEPFGSKKEYLQLSAIHTSYEFRGKGIGKQLFNLISERARAMGAKKLYISSHSAEETQLFYKKMGCTYAKEINEGLAKKEPYDIQLEFDLL